MTRFIFITGGVVSSLGKGITSASLAAILEARGPAPKEAPKRSVSGSRALPGAILGGHLLDFWGVGAPAGHRGQLWGWGSVVG